MMLNESWYTILSIYESTQHYLRVDPQWQNIKNGRSAAVIILFCVSVCVNAVISLASSVILVLLSMARAHKLDPPSYRHAVTKAMKDSLCIHLHFASNSHFGGLRGHCSPNALRGQIWHHIWNHQPWLLASNMHLWDKWNKQDTNYDPYSVQWSNSVHNINNADWRNNIILREVRLSLPMRWGGKGWPTTSISISSMQRRLVRLRITRDCSFLSWEDLQWRQRRSQFELGISWMAIRPRPSGALRGNNPSLPREERTHPSFTQIL